MLPTPDTRHVAELPVYPPSEDSFLMLDFFETQSDFLRSRFPASSPVPCVCEVGTGSGVVTAFLTANSPIIFGRHDVALFALDVNPFACTAAQTTVSRAVEHAITSSAQYIGGFLSNLTDAVRDRSVDLLIFNPPYVPSDELPTPLFLEHKIGSKVEFETETRLLDLAVSGGVDGMETTWKLFGQLDRVLSDRGLAYVLLCARNGPMAVIQKLQDDGWTAAKVGSSGKKGGIEKLCIIRISRQAYGDGPTGEHIP